MEISVSMSKDPNFEQELEKSGPNYAISLMKDWFEDKYQSQMAEKDENLRMYESAIAKIQAIIDNSSSQDEAIEQIRHVLKHDLR